MQSKIEATTAGYRVWTVTTGWMDRTFPTYRAASLARWKALRGGQR